MTDEAPAPKESALCPGCGVAPGDAHQPGCDVERCSVCGLQALHGPCDWHEPEAAKWTGEWPGVAECRERGWYARLGAKGWERCAPDAPRAVEDVNRWTLYVVRGRDA
jgi:hypothetical protein